VRISHQLETHLDPCKKGLLNPVRYQAPSSFNSQKQRQQTIEFGSSAPDFFSQTRFSYSLMQTDFILGWPKKKTLRSANRQTKKKVSKERSSQKRYTKRPQTIPQFGDTKVMNFAKRIEY
jgi:hypothetical protein